MYEEFEAIEKFLEGKDTDLNTVRNYLKKKISSDYEFFSYLLKKYPPEIIRKATIWGHRKCLLVKWRGEPYILFTTGHHSLSEAMVLRGVLAIEFENDVYAANGQYWHYKEFTDCKTIEDFNRKIEELSIPLYKPTLPPESSEDKMLPNTETSTEEKNFQLALW